MLGSTTGAIVAGATNTIAIIRDKSGVWRQFINGTMNGKNAAVGIVFDVLDNGQPWYFGRRGNDSWLPMGEGTIDAIRLIIGSDLGATDSGYTAP